MMDMEQKTASYAASGQTAVRTWLPSNTRGALTTLSFTASRFLGEGVRYKAKLIGVEPVSDAQGDKMCWDTMMKLKGIEVASRRQGKHKPRVWLKVVSNGVKILDERTGGVLYDHDRSRISSLKKDESDPRALAYIYQQQDAYILFYIKTATLADPVLVDIAEVCQGLEQEAPQAPAPPPTQVYQTSPPLLPNDVPALPDEGPASETVFSPRPDASSGQLNQASSTNELMQVFSPQMTEPMEPTQSPCVSQPESPQPFSPPQLFGPPLLSSSQILSLFPMQPAGGAPGASPAHPPNTMPWGQQGLPGNQWAGPPVAPQPAVLTVPNNMQAWAPLGFTVPPAGSQAPTSDPQPGVMGGGSTPSSPTAVNGYIDPLDSLCPLSAATGPVTSAPPTVDQNPFL